MTDRSVTQAEFARILQHDKSYITQLKKANRLVKDEKGLILVDASIERIKQTAGGRDDVAARHAAARGQETPPQDPSRQSESRIDAQTREQMAKADMAEMERDKMRGLLIDRGEAEAALDDAVFFARQGMENFPHRVAAQLVGKDFDQILATLKQEVQAMIGDMHKEAGRQLAELIKVVA